MDTTNTWRANAWKTGVVVGVILAIYLVALAINEFAAIKYVGRSMVQPSTISVSGKGETTAKPDVAVFTYAVSEEAKTVAEAQDKSTAKTNKVLAALKANNVEDKDIKTTSYTINPEYTSKIVSCFDGPDRPIPGCTSSQSVLKGYVVAQSIEVKVRDIAAAGKLFETVGSLGVQSVYGLTFSVDEPESLKAEARAKAIEDAKTKAQQLAKDLGVKIKKISYFYEDSGAYPYAEAMNMSMSAKADVGMMRTAPSIPTGEQKITSNVTITYEIE